MADVNICMVELTRWLWCLRTPIVQAYAVRQRDGFNLIDTGLAGGEDAILRSLAAVDRRPISDVRLYEIVLTHGHDDHTGAAAALVERTGARLLASAIDTPIIEGQQAAPDPQLADWEVQLYEQIHPNVPPAPPACVDAPLDDGASLGWDMPASVIAAPGHTPGSIAVLLPLAKTLIAGDAIASHDGEPILGVFNVDPSQARATFRHLAGLDVDLACFGHGDPLLANAARL
jgi:glyoxylase-like metal-dependent hydrolase (beta-lactamase superfamily II)